MTLNIPRANNKYSLQEPAHRFRQGGRDVYFFALDLGTLDGLLPQRVDDSVVREANRRLTPSHAKNIQVYLNEKDDWVLGALMLGIAPNAVEFEPYRNDDGSQPFPDFGELRILTNRVNTMRIFDGQHRRRAIQEALAELSDARNSRSRDKLDSLQRASMTIVLYSEDDTKTLRQMFVDASNTKRIEGNTVTRFDQRDAFNRVAVQLSEGSRLFNGRVEMERASVARTNRNLLAINQLATMLKILEVGNSGRVSRDLNDYYMRDLEGLYQRCLEWSDGFMPATREEYGDLLSGKVDDAEIPQLRRSTFAYNVTFIRVLAASYFRLMREINTWEPLAEFIKGASITPGSETGLLVEAGLVNPGGSSLLARRQEVEMAIRHIVRAVGEAKQV